MSNPAGEFEQKIIISAGSSDGIRLYDAVVTGRGLVGHVSKVLRDQSRVTMLTDQESAVTARDVTTGAVGILGHGEGSALILDRVPKQRRILENDIDRHCRTRPGAARLVLPAQHPHRLRTSSSGRPTSTSIQDVQVRPFVDFSDLDSVLVLVPKNR